MTISNNMKEIEEISNTSFGCEFCGRKFLRESTIYKHICEYKHRWLEKDRQGNRIAYQTYILFYKKNSASKKIKTYEEFIKSAYYIAFVKFGNYCVDINAININRFAEWLLKNKIKIDTWTSDKNYTAYLIDYLKSEDPLDAVARSIETTIKLAEIDNIQSSDLLRYGNSNRICQNIVNGKISPWMLYSCNSGVHFLETLNPTQIKIVNDYINPEYWALKLKRNTDVVLQIKELLNNGGY